MIKVKAVTYSSSRWMLLEEKWILLYIIHEYFWKNDFLLILWILSDAFELDANVVNFVYYGKTLMHGLGTLAHTHVPADRIIYHCWDKDMNEDLQGQLQAWGWITEKINSSHHWPISFFETHRGAFNFSRDRDFFPALLSFVYWNNCA